jgi:hypothetical protein
MPSLQQQRRSGQSADAAAANQDLLSLAHIETP